MIISIIYIYISIFIKDEMDPDDIEFFFLTFFFKFFCQKWNHWPADLKSFQKKLHNLGNGDEDMKLCSGQRIIMCILKHCEWRTFWNLTFGPAAICSNYFSIESQINIALSATLMSSFQLVPQNWRGNVVQPVNSVTSCHFARFIEQIPKWPE